MKEYWATDDEGIDRLFYRVEDVAAERQQATAQMEDWKKCADMWEGIAYNDNQRAEHAEADVARLTAENEQLRGALDTQLRITTEHWQVIETQRQELERLQRPWRSRVEHAEGVAFLVADAMPTDLPPTDPSSWVALRGRVSHYSTYLWDDIEAALAAEVASLAQQLEAIIEKRDALVLAFDKVTAECGVMPQQGIFERAGQAIAVIHAKTEAVAVADAEIARLKAFGAAHMDAKYWERRAETAEAQLTEARDQLAEARRQIATLTEAAQPFADEKACEEERDRCLDDSGPCCQMHDHWYVGDSTKRLRDVLATLTGGST